MRFLTITCFLFAVIFIATSKANEDNTYNSYEVEEIEDIADQQGFLPVQHYRQKRATCDLLSIFNVNHAACAAHCIGHGYRGGYCSDKQVCTCR